MDIASELSPGRLNEGPVMIPDNIMKFYKIVLAFRRLTYDQIADAAGFFHGSVELILSELHHMKQLFARWVLGFLTDEQMQGQMFRGRFRVHLEGFKGLLERICDGR